MLVGKGLQLGLKVRGMVSFAHSCLSLNIKDLMMMARRRTVFKRERKRENALPGKRPGRPGSSGGLAALSDA